MQPARHDGVDLGRGDAVPERLGDQPFISSCNADAFARDHPQPPEPLSAAVVLAREQWALQPMSLMRFFAASTFC